MLPTAETLGVNVICENSIRAIWREIYFKNSGKNLREFIEYVDYPNFHGCGDTRHANCEGPQYDDIISNGLTSFSVSRYYESRRGDARPY